VLPEKKSKEYKSYLLSWNNFHIKRVRNWETGPFIWLNKIGLG